MNPGVYKICSLNYDQPTGGTVCREVGRIMVDSTGNMEILEDRHGIVSRLFATDPKNAKINFERMERSNYWRVERMDGSITDETSDNVDGWRNQQNAGDVIV